MTTAFPARGTPIPRSHTERAGVTRRNLNVAPWIWWLVPLLAVVAWSWAITDVNTDDLGPYGLLPALPVIWYVALAATLLSMALLTQAERIRHLLLVANSSVLLLLLYGTSAAVAQAPQYAYVYKHIGVTDYIERYGHVDRSIDIYHRWPGFFALAAWFSQNSGFPDPTSYAAWAELLFAAIDALLVFSCVQVITKSARRAWFGLTLFSVSNWVGQNYFSPQAFGFVLMLGILLITILTLPGEPARIGAWFERRTVSLLRIRKPLLPLASPAVAIPRNVALNLMLLLDAVLVVSHQLTPYVLLLQLGSLAFLGYFRPWWLIAAFGGSSYLRWV